MQNFISSALRLCKDLLAPPRRTELIVRRVSLNELQRLRGGADALPYGDPRVQALVWEMKYYRNQKACAIAAHLLRERLLSFSEELIEEALLIPVPMHASGRKERGFHHLDVLCRFLMRGMASGFIRYAPKALMKTRATPRQVELAAAARKKNLVGAFKADPQLVSGRTCIILDDVTTTGATLHEAERALREAGARVVETLTLAA